MSIAIRRDHNRERGEDEVEIAYETMFLSMLGAIENEVHRYISRAFSKVGATSDSTF